MKFFGGVNNDVKSMLSTVQVPGSESPSWDKRRIGMAVVIFILALGVCFGIYHLIWRESDDGDAQKDAAATVSEFSSQDATEGSFIIHFDEDSKSGARSKSVKASTGTLVRVRLLNALKTFDSVPAFVQVLDYSLGKQLLGWTLIGDASGDSNIDRIKMNFHLARNPRSTASYPLSGQALSLDGTLGIQARKLEGIGGRSLLGAARSGTSNITNSNNFSNFLMKALISGLQQEVSSDLNPIYNKASALGLNPGQEFFIQLTEDF